MRFAMPVSGITVQYRTERVNGRRVRSLHSRPGITMTRIWRGSSSRGAESDEAIQLFLHDSGSRRVRSCVPRMLRNALRQQRGADPTIVIPGRIVDANYGAQLRTMVRSLHSRPGITE